MTLRDHLDEVDRGEIDKPRFKRYGRLAPSGGGLRSEHVRCECDDCGSHLLAMAGPGGVYQGSCPVCLSQSVSPVAPRAAV